MGLLDFLNTPQGQALASGIASYAATARRGTPINNLGRGALGAVTGYQNAQDSIVKDEYNKQMMGYNMAQAETARMKAMLEQQNYLKELEDASAERAQGESTI